jgi:hypothetical protein
MSNLNDKEMSPLTLVNGDPLSLRPSRIVYRPFSKDSSENHPRLSETGRIRPEAVKMLP